MDRALFGSEGVRFFIGSWLSKADEDNHAAYEPTYDDMRVWAVSNGYIVD